MLGASGRGGRHPRPPRSCRFRPRADGAAP